jgi:hypothetical protein
MDKETPGPAMNNKQKEYKKKKENIRYMEPSM